MGKRNPFTQFLIRGQKEDFYHSSAYGKAQNAEGIGTASVQSFRERQMVEQNRQMIQGYNKSRVAAERYNRYAGARTENNRVAAPGAGETANSGASAANARGDMVGARGDTAAVRGNAQGARGGTASMRGGAGGQRQAPQGSRPQSVAAPRAMPQGIAAPRPIPQGAAAQNAALRPQIRPNFGRK